MFWPTFMSSEFNDLKEAPTYEEAYQMLLSTRPPEKILQFFIDAAEDKTWVEKSEGELIKPLFIWMTGEFWRKNLSLEQAEKVVEAVQPYYRHLKEYIFYDLDFVLEGKEYPASSLLFAAESEHFRDLIAKSRGGEGIKTTIQLKNISSRFFQFIIEFINTAKLENLWKEEPEEILSVIRGANTFGMDHMAEFAAGVYKRYLDIDNVSTHLMMAEEEGIAALERECCRFITQRFPGIEIDTVEGEGFDLKIEALPDESIPLIKMLASRITELSCRNGILENETFLNLIEKMKALLSVDCSDTTGMDDRLIQHFPPVKTLKIERCQWMKSEDLMQIMSNTPSIIHLSLSGNSHLFIPGTGLFASFNHLSDLDLSYCQQIDDETIDLLASCCPQLLSLSIQDCLEITDIGLREIGRQCQELMTVNLASLPNITSAGIVDLASHSPNISTLNLRGCKNIDERGVKQLFRLLPNLTDLTITGTKVSHQMISLFKEENPNLTIY